MAVNPCKDCGGPVSSDAKSCPNCGAKNVSSLSKILKWGFIIFLCFIIYSCISAYNKYSQKNPIKESTTSANQASTQVANNDSSIEKNWIYDSSTDEMRGTKSFFAKTVSLNSHDFDFPYNGGSKLMLTVRKKGSSNDIYITISKGQILCGSYNGCEVSFKFDDGKVQSITMVEPESHNSDMLFVSYDKTVSKLIDQMSRSKKLTVEVPFYREGKRQFNFDISGLDWK